MLTACCNKLSSLPHSVFMRFLSRINLLVFLKDTDHVLCEIATEVREIFMNFSVFGSGNFDPVAGPCGVVMDELALARICLRVFRFSIVSNISPIYHTHFLNRRTRGRSLATFKQNNALLDIREHPFSFLGANAFFFFILFLLQQFWLFRN